MCGIVGILSDKIKNISIEIIAMRDTFLYRGPDDKGIWINSTGTVALGHRRLSIIDPTSAGHQPMQDKLNRLIIVFNGEIYNYIEIRGELKKKGHYFTTGTDTEVILKAFAQWGQGCIDYFNGMFAFAIWDEKSQKLFLARDRLGIKPLYYFEDNSGFYFASEIKAIKSIFKNQTQIEYGLIDVYMSFGYVPGQMTFIKGVKRLLPGHCMFKGKGVSSIQKYWDLTFFDSKDQGEKYYLKSAESLLKSSIDLRLRSDVPLGIFLSGGLDSSAVVGLLASRVTEPLKTFSVAYDFGSLYNETAFARKVAERFHTNHFEIFVTAKQFQDFIPQFIHLMDEPVTESAAISLYFVSKLAKDQVTVVLSGEGSDEIFAGYDLYRYIRILERYYKLFGTGIGKKFANFGENLLPFGNKIAKYLSLGTLPFEKRYRGISTYEDRYKRRLYNRDFEKSSAVKELNEITDHFLASLFNHTEKNDVLSRMLYFDTKTWLVDDLLIKADRMSMAASLELRVPFLDYRLVEFAATMPSRYKMRGRNGKYLLKKMMEPLLPKEVIYRKKMGFPTPLKIMFEGALADYAGDTLLSSNAFLKAYFKQDEIEIILDEHKNKQMDHHRVIWQLIVLENWLNQN